MLLQTFQLIGIISWFPMIEGLRREAKIVTGDRGVSITGSLAIEPLRSLLGFP